MIKLLCPECRRENEAERIYCHDCGARLDRSTLAKEPPAEEPPQAAHQRLKTLFDPQRAKVRAAFFGFCKVVVGALIAAALLEMLRSPDLPPAKKTIGLPREISMDLENATTNHASAPIRYTEEEVNSYLAYSAKNRHASFNSFVPFERAVMEFREGYFGVTVQHSLFGYRLSVGGDYTVSLQSDKVLTNCKAGRIGRLPIHPRAMQYGGFLFADVLRAFGGERKSLAKVNAIDFHPQLVVITPRS